MGTSKLATNYQDLHVILDESPQRRFTRKELSALLGAGEDTVGQWGDKLLGKGLAKKVTVKTKNYFYSVNYLETIDRNSFQEVALPRTFIKTTSGEYAKLMQHVRARCDSGRTLMTLNSR
jgi:hypothetical protein